MLYGIKNSIFSLRELEYRIKQDYVFKSIIQLNEVPDYSTFSLRAKTLEKHIYHGIYAMFVELINPETRLCAIDGTALRSSKYDSEAKSGKGTRPGYYKGYKSHCIATVTDIMIPLVFDLTIANVYDNQVSNLLYEAKIYNPFLILADAAYEKPSIEEAPTNVAILGRYIITPKIFEILENIKPGKGGEIQLTDALLQLVEQEAMYAYNFEGKRYDVGDKLGFLQATVEYALRKSNLNEEFTEYLKGVVETL
ncbi:transposase [Clostridium botulinum]|nr:transposase [Clostridium botulinum]